MVNDKRVTLTWTAAAENGRPIIEYGISTTPVTTKQTSTSTTHVFTGLVNDVPYTFGISATNLRGEGPVVTAGPFTPLELAWVAVGKDGVDSNGKHNEQYYRDLLARIYRGYF